MSVIDTEQKTDASQEIFSNSCYFERHTYPSKVVLWRPKQAFFDVHIGFSERSGGVSLSPLDSLNVGAHVGDDPLHVEENRARILRALGASCHQDKLLVPRQVHGARVVVVESSDAQALFHARKALEEGADGIVCTTAGVPVLFAFADCTPIVMAAPHAFSVVHAGWRGCKNRIVAHALEILTQKAGCAPQDVHVAIGPHIQAQDYEVSQDLADTFASEFGSDVIVPKRHLDMTRVIVHTLHDVGISDEQIHELEVSTYAAPHQFFSYRRSNGACGRHAAVAYIPDMPSQDEISAQEASTHQDFYSSTEASV